MSAKPDASLYMPSTIQFRAMTHADIALGMRLKAAARWNQLAADWEMLLDTGFGLVATMAGVDVGTATVIVYDGFSWIGMVLVDPAYRRRGIGTALLKAAIAHAESHGSVCLDATPQGEPLYSRWGFHTEYILMRMQRIAGIESPDVKVQHPFRCELLADDRLPDVQRFDASIFGAERAGILQHLLRRSPQYAYVMRVSGRVCGYCLGRSGSSFEQIGPIVAQAPEVARALLRAALGACAGRDVIVDALSDQTAWVAWLAQLGFVPQRPFTRMVLGAPPPGQPACQFAIAGPEIG